MLLYSTSNVTELDRPILTPPELLLHRWGVSPGFSLQCLTWCGSSGRTTRALATAAYPPPRPTSGCMSGKSCHNPQVIIDICHIQSGEKKTQHFPKSIFSYLYLSKYTILCIKLNTIRWTFWWWKLYQKLFYDKYFIRLWKRPLKTTSHKKRLFFKG